MAVRIAIWLSVTTGVDLSGDESLKVFAQFKLSRRGFLAAVGP